jgi:AraC-like DNA-binding protein
MSTIPLLKFSTADFDERDRLEAWRSAIAPMFDIAATPDNPKRFSGEALSAHLGPVIVGGTRVDALAYERTPLKIRTDQLDYYVVRFDFIRGPDNRPIDRTPIMIMDMGQALVRPPAAMDCVCLFVARDAMDAVMQNADALHGRAVDGALGRLLGDYMISLADAAGQMTLEEAPRAAAATQALLAACLAPGPENNERAAAPLHATLRRQARRLIEAELLDPQLSAETLQARLRISRSTLYALFNEEGGVARYIQSRRLAAVHQALADPDERRRIADVADAFGFTNEAHFSRAFRRQFGYAPSEIRGSGLLAPARLPTEDADAASKDAQTRMAAFHRWLSEFR